jgi:hypothetical protein
LHSKSSQPTERVIPKGLETACYELFESISLKILNFCFEYSNLYQVENQDIWDPTSVFVVGHNNNFFPVSQLAAVIRRLVPHFTEQQQTDRAKQFIQIGTFIIPCTTMDTVLQSLAIFDSVGMHAVVSNAKMIERENQLLLIIGWVSKMSGANDDICEIIGESFDIKSLCSIIQHHPRLPARVQNALNDLFVNVMSNKKFKTQMSIAYSIVYKDIAKLFSQLHGCADSSVFTMSVQFLNRENLVSNMCLNYKFMRNIWDAFLEMMERLDKTAENPELFNHDFFQHRRYLPITSDIKVLLRFSAGVIIV